jgi:hypothetical protein
MLVNGKELVFVFGSNQAGIHGKGAALTAATYFGAESGEGEGHFGNSYAIPTKNNMLCPLALPHIRIGINDFIDYAIASTRCFFFVTRVGCGLAGYTDMDIAPLFYSMRYFGNHSIPIEWYKYIYGKEPSSSTIIRRRQYQCVIDGIIGEQDD